MKNGNEVMVVDLKKIELHPDNGRDKKQLKAGLAALVQSLMASGQLIPGLARPLDGGKVQLICGRRRFEALKEIKAPVMALIVRKMSDYEAVEAMVTENMQREGMTLLEELVEVKRLVALGDASALTPEAISFRIGRPVMWAKRVLSLTKLTTEELDKISTTFRFSPSVNLLARFASVSGEEREHLIDECDYADTETEALSRLDEMKIDLSTAVFDTAVCSGCAFNTANSPGLWDDGDQALGMCLNRECFASKARTFHLEKIIKNANSKPEELFYVATRSEINISLPKNVKVLDGWPSREKCAGYLKALVLDKYGSIPVGSCGYVYDSASDDSNDRGSGSSSARKKVSADAPIEKQIEAKEETLKGLRLKLVSEYMREELDAISDRDESTDQDGSFPPAFSTYGFQELLAIGLTVGLRPDCPDDYPVITMDVDTARKLVWAAIKYKVMDILRCQDGSSALFREPSLKNICTMTGLHFDDFYDRASAEKPEPKSLVKLRACQAVSK